VLLIVTSRADYTADWLIIELRRRDVPFVRFNTEDYPAAVGLRWAGDGGAALALRDAEVALDSVAAVWFRRPGYPPVNAADANAVWATNEAREALNGVWRTLDALWVNHPDRNRLAESKPEQLRRAAGLGFTAPATLVTNDPVAAAAFVSEHPAGVVCKPLHSGRVGTGASTKLFSTQARSAPRVGASRSRPSSRS
jgi:hypothetical protein